MWHDLWVVQVPLVEKIVRTVLVYALLLVVFRVAGKRGLANLNTFDFVVIFLLSNVVQNAIIGADNSLLGGVVGAVTLVVVNAAVTGWLARDSRAERLLEGTPTTVIEDGAVLPDVLRKLSMRSGEIEQAVRMQNGDGIDEVALGSLGPDGQLVITLKPSEQNATRGDVEALQHRLAAIEDLLTRLTTGPAGK
jgi:uncharacterized membrane protein YcaP (DUF421 family)